ncbi:MAG: alkaline phosphatase family protein [Myxococcota bacterium]
MRWVFIALVCLGNACTCFHAQRSDEHGRSKVESTQPLRLVVVLVVDQLRGDELRVHDKLLRFGLRRLISEGRWYTQAMHGHLRTETAAGHATIATGLYPRYHGVVDKQVYDVKRREVVGVCEFGASPNVPDVLLAETLGDRLKNVQPAAVVVAMAQKDRSAMLLGGHHADLVTWFDFDRTELRSRQAGGGPLPVWLRRSFEQNATPERMSHLWELPRLPPPYSTWVDDQPGELDSGFGRTFPHRLGDAKERRTFYRRWFTTPDSDRAVLDMAANALRPMGMGQDDVPDVLLVSLGAFDLIGHTFGPDSLEHIAALVELDRALGDFLHALEEQVNGGVLLALTSDHGVAPLVSIARQRGLISGRVDLAALASTLEETLGQQFGPGPHIEILSFPFLRLMPAASAQLHDKQVAAAIAALKDYPGVAAAYATAPYLTDSAPPTDPMEKLLYNNICPQRSGDIVIVLEPYHEPLSRFGDEGSGHGSPWEYDRHVPVVLWGNGIRHARIDQEVAVIDMTRTLEARLGVAADPRGGVMLP